MRPILLYNKLFALYGAQGWWPVKSEFDGRGYHPNKFGLPATEKGRFEVCMGAILTQNTSWIQVEKALGNLFAAKINTAEKILKTSSESIAALITPAGYRNQKTMYLKNMAKWFVEVGGGRRLTAGGGLEAARDDLLKVKGVGRETADSILLYAFHLPTFVIDTYTKRILASLKIFDEKTNYETLRKWFMENLEPSVDLFQEYHALFVEHGKRKQFNQNPAITQSSLPSSVTERPRL
jgi:endonuclease-3 related protein